MATPTRFFAQYGLDNNNYTIINVAAPVSDTDAANKAFSKNAGNLSTGTMLATRLPAFSGDATSEQGFAILTLASTGVSPGTYRSITLDEKGRATAGTNPTTLSEYGITDAINSSLLGVANGVATLGSNGLVLSNQLPSYVDQVQEFASFSSFPVSGITSVIYVERTYGKIYRWSGSSYIEISPTAGNADSATRLAFARTISLSGDGSWSVSFDGTSNVNSTFTLSNSGVTAGTYNSSATQTQSFTLDAKGRVISTGSLVTITPAWTSITSKPTTLAGYGITDAANITHTHNVADINKGSAVNQSVVQCNGTSYVASNVIDCGTF